MTRWVSPQHGKKRTVHHGEFIIGEYRVDITEEISNITVNMYGHVTPASKLKLRILPPEKNKCIMLTLPGSLIFAHVIHRKKNPVLGFQLEEKGYFDPCSNAIEKIRRYFLINLKNGAVRVYEDGKWKPYTSQDKWFFGFRKIARFYRMRCIRDYKMDLIFHASNSRNIENLMAQVFPEWPHNSFKRKLMIRMLRIIHAGCRILAGFRMYRLCRLKRMMSVKVFPDVEHANLCS